MAVDIDFRTIISEIIANPIIDKSQFIKRELNKAINKGYTKEEFLEGCKNEFSILRHRFECGYNDKKREIESELQKKENSITESRFWINAWQKRLKSVKDQPTIDDLKREIKGKNRLIESDSRNVEILKKECDGLSIQKFEFIEPIAYNKSTIVSTVKITIDKLDEWGELIRHSIKLKDSKTIDNYELFSWFKSITEYKTVMQLLVEQGYCTPVGYTWIDRKKGYKKTAASVLEQIIRKSYLKRIPTTKEKIEICSKTWQIDLKSDTIRDIFDLRFDIPISQTSKTV